MKMNKTLLAFGSVCVMSTSGCATIIEGDSQTVYFDSKPSEAACDISREGQNLYKFTTPASLEISKDKDELVITCEKDGYKKAIVHTDSTFQGWTLGNIIFGGIIGVGVDAASGAMNEYPSQVVIPLEKEE